MTEQHIDINMVAKVFIHEAIKNIELDGYMMKQAFQIYMGQAPSDEMVEKLAPLAREELRKLIQDYEENM